MNSNSICALHEIELESDGTCRECDGFFDVPDEEQGPIVNEHDFEDYYRVQMSGITNMFDIPRVMELTGLPKNKLVKIMENYGEYKAKFNVRA